MDTSIPFILACRDLLNLLVGSGGCYQPFLSVGHYFSESVGGEGLLSAMYFFLVFTFIDQKYISHDIFIINILFDHVIGSESYRSKNVFTDYTYIFRA